MGFLTPKRGVDKNGRQYTRLVRPDDSPSDSVRRIPLPAIVSNVPPGALDEHVETSESVLNGIPKKERVNVTAQQLDAVFEVMKNFRTLDTDRYGFRRYIANKRDYYEWSERGAGARYVQRLNQDGDIKDVSLYSISDYESDQTYPTFYEAQAEIRTALGLTPYKSSEVAYLAERYWDSHALPALGNVSSDLAHGLRSSYVESVRSNPHLVPDIIAELKEQPRDEIENLEAYLGAVNTSYAPDFSKFLSKVNEGKVAMAGSELEKLKGFNRSQTSAIMRKVQEIKKEQNRAKRAEKSS